MLSLQRCTLLTLLIQKVAEWILLVFCYAFVGLRVYTRLFVERQKLRLSEYILIFSAVDALGLIICE